MITKDELEKFRTPMQLKIFLDDLMERIKADDVARKEFRLYKGLYSKVNFELRPLAYFSLQNYGENQQVRLVTGNQGYDAELLTNGSLTDKIEFTWAIDGEESHRIAQELNQNGYTKVEMLLDNRRETHKNRCLINMKKKAEKDYSDSTLVFVYDTHQTFTPIDSKDQQIIDSLMNEAKKLNFKAKKVFLFFMPIEINGTDGIKKFGSISLEIK